MESLPAVAIAAILFLMIAVGDVISTRTKARVPAILIAIILYLAASGPG